VRVSRSDLKWFAWFLGFAAAGAAVSLAVPGEQFWIAPAFSGIGMSIASRLAPIEPDPDPGKAAPYPRDPPPPEERALPWPPRF
jgi:hypothetical protein